MFMDDPCHNCQQFLVRDNVCVLVQNFMDTCLCGLIISHSANWLRSILLCATITGLLKMDVARCVVATVISDV